MLSRSASCAAYAADTRRVTYAGPGGSESLSFGRIAAGWGDGEPARPDGRWDGLLMALVHVDGVLA